MFGLDIGISISGLQRLHSGVLFTPSALFANGEDGVSFHGIDTTVLHQDAAGTAPVTATGQSIGRGLDRSGRGIIASQATASLRPAYRRGDNRGVVNLLTGTEDILGSGWSRGADLTVELSAVTPPPGCQQAFRVVKSGSVTTTITQNLGAVGKTGDRRSIYARTVSGTGTLAVMGYFGFTKYRVNLTEQWQRFDAPVDVAETGGGSFYAVDFRFGNLTEVIIAAPQQEPNGTLTPYQRNGGNLGGVPTGSATDLHWLERTPANATLPAIIPSLGTNATVWYATTAGTTILTGQTVPAGPFDTVRGERTYAVGALNRPLTQAETVALTQWLGQARGA